MLDVVYKPPALHGIDWSNPSLVMEYEISQNEAIRKAFEELNRQGNNPRYILIDGEPLDQALKGAKAWPGDVKWFHGKIGKAREYGRKYGWTVCDGSNGTVDMMADQRFVRSVAKGADSGTTGGSECHLHALASGSYTTCDGGHGHDDTFAITAGQGSHGHADTFGTTCTDVCHDHVNDPPSTGIASKAVCVCPASETCECTDVATWDHTHAIENFDTCCTSIEHSHGVSGSVTNGGTHPHAMTGAVSAGDETKHRHALPARNTSCVDHTSKYVEYIPMMKK